MKKKTMTLACFFPALQAVCGTPVEPRDSIRLVDMEEVIVVAAPKENVKLKQQPLSSSLFSRSDMAENQIFSLKNLTALVPGFFMPDYGSRLTSATYIRGVGSRINTPAVGLYVDNIPYLDKSAFDFNLYDIERIDVLRGPQSTLYGRNAMGGLMRIYTRNPFRYQGTNVEVGGTSANNAVHASLTHYHRISRQFAFSVGGFYEHARGYFRNEELGRWADPLESGGGRVRAIWLPTENWRLDFTANYEYTDQGGYAYGVYNKDTRAIDPIRAGHESGYRRGLLNAGLSASWQGEAMELSSITSYQRLDDRMYIDQDFLPTDLYTLCQRQHLNAFTQELSLKSRPGSSWQWVTGVFGSWQGLRTQSPVTFRADGMEMLEGAINSAMSSDKIPAHILSMGIGFPGESMPISADFDTPTASMAVFHQTTLDNLLWPGLSLTLGLRLDHERLWMDYRSGVQVDYNFDFHLRMPERADIQLSPTAVSMLDGRVDDHYTQLLPKVALQYTWNGRSNVYATVSRGYRSGGYNIQMFSDLARTSLQNAMMAQVKDGLFGELDALAQKGEVSMGTVAMGKQMMERFIPSNSEPLDVHATTYYRPEYSWNYEVGAHLTLWDGRLQTDVAAYWVSTQDQQVSRFVSSGLGRIMVNAGRSRSLGVEASALAQIDRSLRLNASYGYTRATFRDYNLGGEDGGGGATDYTGNTVPFTPRHTLGVGASYTFFFRHPQIKSLAVQAGYTGTGSLYWTEQNTLRQPFYGVWRSGVELETSLCTIGVWGRNLADKQYAAFCFETMGEAFAQPGVPRQFGVDFRFNF